LDTAPKRRTVVIATFFYLLCLGSWIGSIVFFSFFTAPIVFSRLPVAEAGKVVSGIFPFYYALGYGTGTIALALTIYFARIGERRSLWVVTAVLLAVSLCLTLYAGVIVRPRTTAFRTVVEDPNPDPIRKAEFDQLHKLSVRLNGGVLRINLFALASSAAALARNA
jgi:uncharacterized membrane protein